MGVRRERRCGRQGGKQGRRDAERYDLTRKDSYLFPMYVEKGGMQYGFCPGKAKWDHEAMALYEMLVTTAHTGALWDGGGLSDQPDWYLSILAWFLPMYDRVRFFSRAKAILGDGKEKKKGTGGRSIGRR